jgi:predicted lipoprotein with Yx(FWY)xxD motif
MRIKATLGIVVVAAITVFVTTVPFASGSAPKAPSAVAVKASSAVKVSTRAVTGLGTVLVNGQGMTLYMFAPDKQKKVTCVGSCAAVWPPLFLKGGAKKASAGGAAKASLLGSDKDPAGGRVVTYNHWPLYLFLGDKHAGQATGQDINANGGYWYVLTPSGALIKHKPHSGGTTSTSSSSTSNSTTSTSSSHTSSTTTSTTSSKCDDADNDGDQSAGGPDDGDGCL